MKKTAIFLFLAFSIFLTGCELQEDQDSKTPESSFTTNPPEVSEPSQPEREEPEPEPEIPEHAEHLPQEIFICSPLSFLNIEWPSEFDNFELNSMALAMSLSGSFEGRSGWSNISNNFDDQGLSLGLFNQNFGQGSLQPLLIELHKKNPQLIYNLFSKSFADSLVAMLQKWQSKAAFNSFNSTIPDSLPQNLGGFEQIVLQPSSDIDKFYFYPQATNNKITSRNMASVTWAIKNIYSDSKGLQFIPKIKQALKDLADSPEYITLQIKAALKIHDRAKSYLRSFEFNDVRSYLFFFDVVVQNGSMSESHRQEYFRLLARQPNLSLNDRLLKLLEIRLQSSNPRWRDDVRKRKQAIILGKGQVHGVYRNLPKEYCYNPWAPYWPPSEP